MILIVLGDPTIVINHKKAIEIKTKYLNGERLASLQNEYNFEIEPMNNYILIS